MKLTIIGASGHGKVVASIAKLCGYDEIEFLDDNPAVTSCAGYPVVGTSTLCAGIENDIFVGIGNAKIRQKLMEQYSEKRIPCLVHPDAVIAEGVVLGRGTVVMAGTVVNSETVIGSGVIINTCSSVGHDCIVHDYVHVAAGAHVCGTVEVGERTWVGAGSTVSNNINICEDCLIGAGAVVIKNIQEPGTYVGVPAVKKSRTPSHTE
ncbi:MAG: acetyltransferase [Bacillota bacterium]|jgi:sugar O-acyltransferase (sialic acid O-acetyltransferase NeuD family)